MTKPNIHQSSLTSTCWFCHKQVECQFKSVNTKTSSVQYICSHSPLSIEWWYTRQLDSSWIVDIISIILPEQFMLQFAEPSNLGDENNGIFYLFEWKRHQFINGEPFWKNVCDNNGNDKGFHGNYILSQSPEKILSLFNMYKTFS